MSQWSPSWGSAWVDFDRDGDPDALVNRHRWRAALMRHGLDRYRRAEHPAFDTFMDRHNCLWGEANGDSRTDFVCMQGADRGQGEGNNELWLRSKSGFTEVGASRGMAEGLARGRTANWIDYDRDGDLDLFFGNELRDGSPNRMFQNDGEGHFVSVDVGVGAEVETTSSSWSDWDLDGDPDLLVLDKEKATWYENSGGTFRAMDAALMPAGRWKSAGWGDTNGDEWPDLFVLNNHGIVVLENDGGAFRAVYSRSIRQARSAAWLDLESDRDLDLFVVRGRSDAKNLSDFLLVSDGGRFTRVNDTSIRGPRAGDGDSVAVVDHDRDGRLDLFVQNGAKTGAGPDRLYKNTSASGNWSAIDLRGPRHDPHGFGATLQVTTGQHTWFRHTNDGAGTKSQSEAGYVHLGLGPATYAQVRVAWPDGTQDCLFVSHASIAVARHGGSPCP